MRNFNSPSGGIYNMNLKKLLMRDKLSDMLSDSLSNTLSDMLIDTLNNKSEVRKFISIITTIYIPSKGIKCYKFV